MNNKRQIEKLRDNAELAWSAYGYFDLIGKRFDKKILKDIDRESTPIITQTDILDSTYKGYKIYAPPLPSLPNLKPEKIGTLNGDFSPTQAKKFFEKYELLNHQHNTTSGLSATLFQDKESKEHSPSYSWHRI